MEKTDEILRYGLIEWIMEKKNLEEELSKMDKLDKAFVDKRTQCDNLAKKYNILKQDLIVYEELQDKYLKTIKDQRKEINKLKKREKKLIQIEEMFNNKKLILKELKELVKGE